MTATLERYMTRHPHSIRVDEKAGTASKLMASLGVRHLPVLDGGQLVGVISDRDLKIANESTRVSDVCIDEPYTVDIETSLFIVATTMSEKKIGSAIVTEDGRLAGIFTATDACRALADTLAPRS